MADNYHDEEILGKAYDSRLMRRLLTYVRPYRLQVAMAVMLLFLDSVTQLAGPYLTKIAVDRYIIPRDMAGLYWVTLVYIGVLAAGFGLAVGQTYLTQWIGQRIMYDLRVGLFAHLQSLSSRFFDRNPVGRLITRVTSDVETLNQMFTAGIVAIFGDIFTLIGIFAVLLYLDWRLALLSFSVLPLLIYGTVLFKTKVRQAYRDVRIRIARINSFLQENIVGMSVVQLFNREPKHFARFDELNDSHFEAHLRSVRYHSIFFPVVELISALAIALIVWVGGGSVIKASLTFGTFFAFIQYVQRFFRPIADLSEKYNIMQAAMASSERIFKLMDKRPEIVNPPHPARLGRIKGRIEFRNVNFEYVAGEPVLRDISFEVAPGQTVALVGATGSGKSTITNLISRFYDVTSGQVLVDGQDVRDVDMTELRSQIALVLQDVFLFTGTIRDNIRLGKSAIEEERLLEASTIANAHRFISRMAGAYDAPLGERGSNISTGQRQLLSFARALAFDPRILILDEATSSVDTETEMLIQQALDRLLQNRTAIVVAHRLSTIKSADNIIVLHRGKIREMGSHQQLLALGGMYFRLYELQHADKEERRAAVMAV